MTNNTPPPPNREKPEYTDETTILKPADIHIHTDEWPCFVLKEAVVYKEDCWTLANLLDAELDGPLVVRGQLHLDKGQRRHMITSYSKGQPVEVSDVREFSFDEDGNIWAKGVAGWFEVEPATPYREIHDVMVTGVNLYFFVADLHIEQAGKKRNGGIARLDVDSIIEAYIKRKSPSKSLNEVTEVLKSNGVFLMSMMRKPHSQIQWKRSAIYSWLVQELPEIYSKFDNVAAKEKGKASNGNSRNSRSKSPALPGETATSSVAPTVIFYKMEESHSTGRCLRESLTLSRLGKILYEDYDLESVFVAQEFVVAHARAIVRRLRGDWLTSPIAIKLNSLISNPKKSRSEQKELLKITLRPRKLEERTVLEHMEISSDDSRPRTRNRTQKGVNNEDGDVYGYPSERADTSKKGKMTESVMSRTSGKRRTRNDESLSESGPSVIVRPTVPGGSKSGKVAALRLKRSSPSRDDDEIQSQSDMNNDRPRKSQRTLRSQMAAAYAEYHVEEEDSTSEEEEEEEEGEDEEEQEEKPEAPKELMLVEECLPTLEPQGPDGEWICPKPECGHQIYKADEEEGQESIKEHYAEHMARTKDQMDRIKLVQQESRPHLPISHLLEKLKRLGEEAIEKEKKEINGRVIPQPIKRERIKM